MKAKPDQRVSDQEYASVFENTPTGQRILADLVAQFGKGPVLEGGIDGIRKSDYRAGQRSVPEHILRRINRAAGVNDPDPQE